ncbi:MAG: hypothetical protein EOS63_29280 [Mesorhizobium sp.]|nr:MAG: hypothetical protein EOS63_29280 [Mesorhizobium sp.]TIW78004.1 MAG: hypothetical protein E5V53_23865 [Mesorhizobium sp.]
MKQQAGLDVIQGEFAPAGGGAACPLADFGASRVAAEHGNQHARCAIHGFAQRQPGEGEQHRREKLRALSARIPGSRHHTDAGNRTESRADHVQHGLQPAKGKLRGVGARERGKGLSAFAVPGALRLQGYR